MHDPITEPPPPSRFDPEELDTALEGNEAPLLPPFVAWSIDAPPQPLRPKLLIVCVSEASCTLVHHLPSKRLIASLVLPEVSMANVSAVACTSDQTCSIYTLGSASSTVAVTLQHRVPPERSHAWSKALFGVIQPEGTLILDALLERCFRSSLSMDDNLLFVLESDAQKAADAKDGFKLEVPYLPSGSLVDGVSGAILTHCQVRSMAARLLLSWPSREVRLLGDTLRRWRLIPDSLGLGDASKAIVGIRKIPKYELYT